MPSSAAAILCAGLAVEPAAAGRGRGWARFFQAFVWLMAWGLSLTLGLQATMAADAGRPPDEVRAAILINFPKYVDWPPTAFAQTNSPIVLAVFGDKDQGEALRKMVEGKTINGHRLAFKQVNTEEEITSGFHILFIGASEQRRIPAILEKCSGLSVLTVGESDDFLEKGGIINLASRDRKIRLEVNLLAANQARLKINSKLLAIADVVKGKSN
jgi:hypothetical protein